ncbi:MAG: hypothetical protein IT429_26295, partial [Gemmataceae bacterium]|nr:hypothetical protein [Gemmataceae bacterium]
ESIVAQSGTWFSYKDVRLGQGRENVKQFLRDHQELCSELRTAILAKRLPPPPAADGKVVEKHKDDVVLKTPTPVLAKPPAKVAKKASA